MDLAAPQGELVEVQPDHEPPEPPLPTGEAPLMDRDGNPVLDAAESPVTVPLEPSESTFDPANAFFGPTAAIRRRVTGPDGSPGEIIEIRPR